MIAQPQHTAHEFDKARYHNSEDASTSISRHLPDALPDEYHRDIELVLDWHMEEELKYLIKWAPSIVEDRFVYQASGATDFVHVGSSREVWEIVSTERVGSFKNKVTWRDTWLSHTKVQQHHLVDDMRWCRLDVGYEMSADRVKEFVSRELHHILVLAGEDVFKACHQLLERCTRGAKPRKTERLNTLLSYPQHRAVLQHRAFFDKEGSNAKIRWELNEAKLRAIIVQGCGFQVPEPCTTCRKGQSAFHVCVSLKLPDGHDFFRGSCACCAYGSRMNWCSLRRMVMLNRGLYIC